MRASGKRDAIGFALYFMISFAAVPTAHAITALPLTAMVQSGKTADICPLFRGASAVATAIAPSIVTAPSNGSVSFMTAKTWYWRKNPSWQKLPVTWFKYTPAAGFTGLDSFTFRISDGAGESQVETCRIRVHPPEPGGVTVLLVVNNLLYAQIKPEVDRLKADLDAEGYQARIAPFVFTKTSTDTAEARRLWDTLKTEYERPDRLMAGALLVGRLPLATVPNYPGGILRYDDPYWCMDRFFTDVIRDSLYLLFGDSTLTTSDTGYTHGTNASSRGSFGHGMRHVWAGRFWGQNGFGTSTINDSTGTPFGSESLLVKRMLDANHHYRTGASRYPHKASIYDLFRLSNLKASRFADIWPDTGALPYKGTYIVGPDTIRPVFTPYQWGQAGELFEYSGHSNSAFFNPTVGSWNWARLAADSIFSRSFQQRVVLISSCHTADPGNILSHHLMSRNGGGVLAISTSAFIQTYAYLSLADTGIVKAAMRVELASGTRWGRSWINSGMPLMQLFMHGDPSLKAKMSPHNEVPVISELRHSLSAGKDRFEVSATDPDGAIQTYEWWISRKYHSGRNEPDTVTAVPMLETPSGVYTGYVRVEAVDQYMARDVTVGVGLHADAVAAPLTMFAPLSAAPNPFNRTTRIAFSVSKSAPVTLSVMDSQGRLVRRLSENSPRSAGTHSVEWNGKDSRGIRAAAGIYVVKLETSSGTLYQRILLAK